MTQEYKYDEKTNSYVPASDKNLIDHKDRLIAALLWGIQFFDITFWPIVVTIVAYTYFKGKNEFLYQCTRNMLNFEITLLIYLGITTLLYFVLIGFLIIPIVGLYHIIIPILGIIKALDKEVYKPHFTIDFIK